ncbi:MAG: hypothetical protein OXU51_21605 [Candidatus Poribacteria bacterium]|nr:hypothetical protein [Candidatus Poribacteria bacterium]
MKHVILTTLLLLIFGIAIVGCSLTVGPEMRKTLDTESPIEKYTGPQTVEALMEAFDARYSSRAVNTKWATTSETPYDKKRHLEFTLVDMDAKYPRDKWLQMLLNKGITIENFEAYNEHLNVRSDLILKEFHTKDDWKTVKAAYIDTLIQKYQDKQVNPAVENWVVLGENRLPVIPGRMYVQKTESGARIWHTTRSTSESWDGKIVIHSVKGPELSEKQKSDLLNNGVEPVGWEVVYLDEKGNHTPQDR